MLITINGPYKKYNQEIASKVTKEIKKLYPDMKVFLYDNPPTNELDNLTSKSPKYNHYLHIARILNQMALDIQSEEGENKPLHGCIRDYIDREDKLVIATEWYSSAILRVLSHIIQYQLDQLDQFVNPVITKLNLVDFAFKLVEAFHLPAPDLNIVFIPNETEMEDDINHRITCTKTLTKNQATIIKESYINYNNCLHPNSYNVFSKNEEYYVPVYILNRSDVIIPDTNIQPTTIPKFLEERYENFHKKILEHQSDFKTQTEVVQDITDIIKTYIDIVNKSIEVAPNYAITTT